MTDKITLAQALQRAALDLNAAEPPPHLLAAVQARWAPQPAAKPPAVKPRRQPWAWPGAAVAAVSALALVLVGSVLLMLQTPPADQPGLHQQQLAQAPQVPQGPGADGSRFVNLVPPERWPREASAAWLVRTEIPSHRLAVLGLPFDPASAGQPVRAEMLMRASGEVLAVRFVP